MDLSVADAAELLGLKPRALRARLARGSLPGHKVDGAWFIRREDLPLTEAQRGRIQDRATRVRAALDAAVPERVKQGRTLLDLDVFRWGAEVLDGLRSDDASEPARDRLRAALVELGRAMHTWDRAARLASLDRARGCVGEAAALLLIAGPLPPPVARGALAARLERQVAPGIAGLSRWTARQGRSG